MATHFAARKWIRLMNVTQAKWRLANPADVPTIGRLSRKLLGVLGEEDIIFEERQRLCPEGCHVFSDGAEIGAYIVSHPWRRGQPPALNQSLSALPADADCWYIHDIAVDRPCRGTGAAATIVNTVTQNAHQAGFSTVALVAVADALAFWNRLGFRDAMTDDLRRTLNSYGADACYMERPTAAGLNA